MISERENIAAQYNAEGLAQAQIIMNTTDREVAITLSNAEAEAARIIAEGEAEYMRTLSEAYNTPEKSEFYNYVRSLDAFKESLGNGEKTIILDKNSELARMFYMNH